MLPTKRQSGFTLLEVVMAITLMTGVVLMLFVSLRVAMGALERGSARLEEKERGLAAFDAVQSQVSGAIPKRILQGADGRPVNVVCFDGTSQRVQFLTGNSWAGDRSTDFWLATYWVRQREDGQQQLMIGETAVPDTDHILQALLESDVLPKRSEPFGEPASRVELFYWGTPSDKNPPTWVADWKAAGQEELPRGIQVRWQRGQEQQTATFPIPVQEEAP